MNKNVFLLLGLAATSLFAANKADEELFLHPHVGQVSEGAIVASLHVGCHAALPDSTVAGELWNDITLQKSMREVAKKLEPHQFASIVVPASLGVVFSDGSRSDGEVYEHISQILDTISEKEEASSIKEKLSSLTEVNWATFVTREERLVLLTDERALKMGETIWRKTPDGAEMSVYHSDEEYVVAIHNAGLKVEEIKRPCFFGSVKWRAYHDTLQGKESRLGPAYMDHNPFTIFVAVKEV